MCVFVFVSCVYKCYGEAIKLYPGPIIPCAPDTEKQSPNTGILQLSTSPPPPTLVPSSSPSRSSLSSSYKRKAKDPLRNAQELGQLSKDAWREMKNFLTGMRMMTMILKREKRINVMTVAITIQFRKDDEGNIIYSG